VICDLKYEGMEKIKKMKTNCKVTSTITDADNGDTNAQIKIAYWYERGHMGLEVNLTKAWHYYRRSSWMSEFSADIIVNPSMKFRLHHYKSATLYFIGLNKFHRVEPSLPKDIYLLIAKILHSTRKTDIWKLELPVIDPN
jgi:hypothetical protein